MFYVTDQKGNVLAKYEDLTKAKQYANGRRAANPSEHFRIEKREWVWSTKTLADLDRKRVSVDQIRARYEAYLAYLEKEYGYRGGQTDDALWSKPA